VQLIPVPTVAISNNSVVGNVLTTLTNSSITASRNLRVITIPAFGSANEGTATGSNMKSGVVVNLPTGEMGAGASNTASVNAGVAVVDEGQSNRANAAAPPVALKISAIARVDLGLTTDDKMRQPSVVLLQNNPSSEATIRYDGATSVVIALRTVDEATPARDEPHAKRLALVNRVFEELEMDELKISK